MNKRNLLIILSTLAEVFVGVSVAGVVTYKMTNKIMQNHLSNNI